MLRFSRTHRDICGIDASPPSAVMGGGRGSQIYTWALIFMTTWQLTTEALGIEPTTQPGPASR